MKLLCFKQVFWICVWLLEVGYSVAMLMGMTSLGAN